MVPLCSHLMLWKGCPHQWRLSLSRPPLTKALKAKEFSALTAKSIWICSKVLMSWCWMISVTQEKLFPNLLKSFLGLEQNLCNLEWWLSDLIRNIKLNLIFTLWHVLSSLSVMDLTTINMEDNIQKYIKRLMSDVCKS